MIYKDNKKLCRVFKGEEVLFTLLHNSKNYYGFSERNYKWWVDTGITMLVQATGEVKKRWDEYYYYGYKEKPTGRTEWCLIEVLEGEFRFDGEYYKDKSVKPNIQYEVWYKYVQYEGQWYKTEIFEYRNPVIKQSSADVSIVGKTSANQTLTTNERGYQIKLYGGKQSSSYIVAKVVFDYSGTVTIRLCSYGESGYDYGAIQMSKNQPNNMTSSTIPSGWRNVISASLTPTTFTYEVESGDWIHIAYRKDGSVDSNDDAAYFDFLTSDGEYLDINIV